MVIAAMPESLAYVRRDESRRELLVSHRRGMLWGVNLLLVLSVVPWRSDSIFAGGIDPVVVGKAIVATVALAGAAGIALSARSRFHVGLAPAFVAITALLVSLLGAAVAGDLVATAVLGVRIIFILSTVLLLVSAVPWEIAVANLLKAMATVALVAAITGVPGALTEGRLGGGVPELHPNGLAGLASTPLVGLVASVLHRGVRVRAAIAAGTLGGIVVATGSRTALLAVAAALVVAIMVNGIRDRAVVYGLLVSVPLLYAIATFSDIFTDFITRAGSTDATSTLESRFTAWIAVLGWDWSSWQKWIGLGLATKTVDVDAQWWDEQVLDSSWVSILAQAGILGALLLGLLVSWCVITASTSRRRRWLILPILVLVLLRSVTESGLFDSSEPFVVLIILSAVLTRRSRFGAAHRSSEVEAKRSWAAPRPLTSDDLSPRRSRSGQSAGER